MGCHSQLFCHIFATQPESTLELRLTLIIELTQFHGWYASFSPLGFIFTGLPWSFSLLVQGQINVFACCSCITIHNNPKLNFTWRNRVSHQNFSLQLLIHLKISKTSFFSQLQPHVSIAGYSYPNYLLYISVISWNLWPRLLTQSNYERGPWPVPEHHYAIARSNKIAAKV